MPDFSNLSLQEHGGGGPGVADDPYGTHSSRPSFYGGCGYSREYWRNLAGPDYHRAKLSPGSLPRHGPSSPRHASPGRRVKNHLCGAKKVGGSRFWCQKGNFPTNVGLHTGLLNSSSSPHLASGSGSPGNFFIQDQLKPNNDPSDLNISPPRQEPSQAKLRLPSK